MQSFIFIYATKVIGQKIFHLKLYKKVLMVPVALDCM